MKKTFLLFIFLFICNMFANAESSYLVIRCTDGSRLTYLLSDEPILTIEGPNMAITSKVLNVEHPLNNIERITYETGSEASLEKLYEDTSSYYIKDNILNVVNEVSDFTVYIYDINGNCVITRSYDKSEAASIPLNNLEKGIYILTINKNSFKFHIK